ncbi:MAG: NFACT family protein, partial [Lachnospiraceae bacterium]|nr:NFACT family protein [Lachnospiraceae bacterium]
MAFDGITVAALRHELNSILKDGRINKVAQPEPNELLLTIKTGTGQVRLLISASATLPLVYLTDTNKVSPAVAPAFCMLLRKHLTGARIMSVTQPGLERVLHIDL